MRPVDLPNQILARLAARATVDAYRESGPIPPEDLEQASRELREAGVDLLRRGYELHAQQAWITAERIDETAEVARACRSTLGSTILDEGQRSRLRSVAA